MTEEGEQKGDRKIGIVRTCGSRTVSAKVGVIEKRNSKGKEGRK